MAAKDGGAPAVSRHHHAASENGSKNLINPEGTNEPWRLNACYIDLHITGQASLPLRACLSLARCFGPANTFLFG